MREDNESCKVQPRELNKEKINITDEEIEQKCKAIMKEGKWKLDAMEAELEDEIIKEKHQLAEAREDLFCKREEFEREKNGFSNQEGKPTEATLKRNLFGFTRLSIRK